MSAFLCYRARDFSAGPVLNNSSSCSEERTLHLSVSKIFMWLLATHLASSSHVLSDEQVKARSSDAVFSLASAQEKILFEQIKLCQTPTYSHAFPARRRRDAVTSPLSGAHEY